MELGSYIEHKLKEKKLTKIWLHNQLKNTFHHSDEKYLNYNSFSIKLSNNKLRAIELIEISCILDLDLNQLKRYLFNNTNTKKSSGLSSIKKTIIKTIFHNSLVNKYINLNEIFSSNSNNNLVYDILELESNVFNFFIYSKELNIASLELFNFNNNIFVKLCDISDLNSFLSEKKLNFNELYMLNKKELLNILMQESEEYFLLYPEQVPTEHHIIINN